jgi:hypothetical protein
MKEGGATRRLFFWNARAAPADLPRLRHGRIIRPMPGSFTEEVPCR